MNLPGKKQHFLFLLMTFFFLHLSAQITVTGTVLDAESNTPLPETNIQIAGTNKGATSDFDGLFSQKTWKLIIVVYSL